MSPKSGVICRNYEVWLLARWCCGHSLSNRLARVRVEVLSEETKVGLIVNDNEKLMKKEKLLRRPVESDTQILMQDLIDFGRCIGLMELWIWEGITASSVIFLLEDVAGLSKDEQIDLAFGKTPRDPKTTYQVNGDYVYINYGFCMKD